MTNAPTAPNDLFVKEVAAPGSVFWESTRHAENIEILEGDERARQLPPARLKLAKKKVEHLQAGLNEYWRAYAKHLKQQQPPDAARIEEIEARISKQAKRHGKPYVIKTMDQAKEAQILIHRLRARISEHYRALDHEALNRRLQDEMEQEIAFYAHQLVDRWTALGYREEYYIEGKRKLRKVHFEECHFTEDNIQFKVYVTHLTLFGSTVHHLPDRVHAWDLVKPETLRELEAACECPVTSPHADGEQNFEKGCWVVVHRVGMRDGLFNYIELNKVLSKYNQGLRPHFAVPVGIKAGRIIEYLKLSEQPHLMFNGITGSGKTNVARVFLSVWSQFFSPDEIRFFLVDLKRSGDLNHFEQVPHLLGGKIIKDIDELTDAMPRFVALMQQRMNTLSTLNATDIDHYNSKVAPANQMERIVILIDECGSIRDLALHRDTQETIWRCLALLAMQARAAGIHLMLGTQQPSKEAIPTRVTNNITYTLSGRQRTTSGAMAALGNNQLKNLPAIKGRMLIDNGYNLLQVQTPYATEGDILKAIEVAQAYPTPRPFSLPSLEESNAVLDEIEVITTPGVTSAQIVDLALIYHEGVLNAQKLYERTEGVTPRAAIMEMIKSLAAAGEIENDGVVYEVRPRGKGWCLVEKTEKPSETPSEYGFSDGVSTVLQNEELEMENT